VKKHIKTFEINFENGHFRSCNLNIFLKHAAFFVFSKNPNANEIRRKELDKHKCKYFPFDENSSNSLYNVEAEINFKKY
jgi:hypothetical protein